MTCEPMFLASGSLANVVLLFYRQVFYCVKAVINHLDSCTVFPTYHLQKRKKNLLIFLTFFNKYTDFFALVIADALHS